MPAFRRTPPPPSRPAPRSSSSARGDRSSGRNCWEGCWRRSPTPASPLRSPAPAAPGRSAMRRLRRRPAAGNGGGAGRGPGGAAHGADRARPGRDRSRRLSLGPPFRVAELHGALRHEALPAGDAIRLKGGVGAGDYPGRKRGMTRMSSRDCQPTIQGERSKMSLRIQTNIEAFNAHRNLVMTSNALGEVDGAAVVRLPHQPRRRRRRRPGDQRKAAGSGPRHRPGSAQRPGRGRLVQTSEGSLNEVHSMLQRIRELAVQYKNGSLVDRRPHRSSPRSTSSPARSSGSGQHRIQRHQAAERRSDDHVPGRRQRRRGDHRLDDQPRRSRRRGSVRIGRRRRHRSRSTPRSTRSRPSGPSSARSRTASNTPSTTWPSTRKT